MRRIIFTDSSNIKSAAWHEGVLEVTFNGGATYQYQNVQIHQFGELAAAPSAGRWVHATLVKRTDSYPCKQVMPAQSLDELVCAHQALGLIASAPAAASAGALREIAREALEATLTKRKDA